MITADFTIVPIGTKDTECKEYVTNEKRIFNVTIMNKNRSFCMYKYGKNVLE